eukprot:4827286-Heterocapsa_arctica.AAC.1
MHRAGGIPSTAELRSSSIDFHRRTGSRAGCPGTWARPHSPPNLSKTSTCRRRPRSRPARRP